MAVHNQWQIERAVKGGVIAGLVSGVVLSVILAILNALEGKSVLGGLKFASYPFLGRRAFDTGFDHVAIVAGVASHLAVSVVWGALFGLIFFGLSRGKTLVAGAFWGLVVWAVMLYVVLPVLGFPAGGDNPVAMAIFTHALFGVTMAAAFLPFQRVLPPLVHHRSTPGM
jgi:hypothetical protein